MSSTAKNERRVITGVDPSGPVPVEYRFSHAKNGSRHLVVVFANLNAPDEYGMGGGILENVRSNILWIRDSFDGANSYYLCKGMDFGIEQSVAGLIARVMNALSLTPDQCTMFGSSKGGSAALHFGLKFGYRNIIASAPQFRIGTFVVSAMANAARAMMGEVTEDKVRFLDSVLPEVVRGSANRAANIYLVSSPQDRQYPIHIEPFLGLFQGYENFNFIFNDSPLISGHDKVTTRNIPSLVSLLNLVSHGITPRIGAVRNGLEEPKRDTSAIDAYLSATSQVRGDDFPAPVVLMPAADERLPARAIRFAGSAPGAVRVSIWENGKFQASPPVGPDGSWIWERETPWAKGRHVVRLFGVDADNFHSGRTEVVFTATDEPAGAAQPPVLSVTSPVPGQQVQGPAVRFTGLAPGAVRVDFQERGAGLGTCEVTADGAWTWDPAFAWNEGDHVVEAVAVDAAGNASAWASVPFALMNAYIVPTQGGYTATRY
ncbi:Ig-like domain-containing protein [Streptomyces sp. IBSNAI002]|uniref:Ig-like domain-containing protein n=1 Tax=Streptomyces sp. IBSNAI002 TaxID=3457500 RepID=UPI003FD4A4CA